MKRKANRSATSSNTKGTARKSTPQKAPARRKTRLDNADSGDPTTTPPAPKPPDRRLKSRAAKVIKHLQDDYPDAACALVYETPFQLLVATILSAQCTDERVNLVTKDLFRRWPTAADLAAVPIPTLEKAIQSTGFFRNKAKNIKGASQDLVDMYDGQVPQNLDQLVQLAGVGRKTANVVLGTAYGIPTGVVVDTHVTRLSNRLALTTNTDPVKIERDLMQLVPKSEWIDFSHRLIHHGRQICTARKPKCEACSMNKICPKIGLK